MRTLIRRHLVTVLNIAEHQYRLCIFIVGILSLASIWISQQSYSGVTELQSADAVTLLRPAMPAAAAAVQSRTEPASSPYKRRRLFVRLPGLSARLGNRMFAHAALLGLAADTGLEAAVSLADDEDLLRSVFDLTTPVVTDVRQDHLRTVEWPWRAAIYVPPPSNLTNGAGHDDDIQLVGYFQSWRYFQAVNERVRAEFRFRKRVADAAERILWRLTVDYRSSSLSKVVLVGIHVRRSDMTMDEHLRRGYTVADRHYIRRAMNYVADRVTTTDSDNSTSTNRTSTTLLFVVCTDDNDWARRHVRSASYPVVFATSVYHRAEIDLAILASCDHVITTVGTFSWWAGYLHRADGITVYYAGFPKPGSEIANDFHAEDFFPPGWIGLL